jgi:transposase InsO family protein
VRPPRDAPVDGRGRIERGQRLAESFNATLEREILAGAAGWDSPGHARRDVFAWITRYNTGRRRSACGRTSPNAYEACRTPAPLPIAA